MYQTLAWYFLRNKKCLLLSFAALSLSFFCVLSVALISHQKGEKRRKGETATRQYNNIRVNVSYTPDPTHGCDVPLTKARRGHHELLSIPLLVKEE